MNRYYAVQFRSDRDTTTGEPNKRSGRMSRACDLSVFSDKKARDAYVENGKITADMRGNCREAVNKQKARNLKAGIEFEEHIDYMLDATQLI